MIIDNTNETIADIVCEMRDRAITKIGGRTITARNFVPQETCEAWADRIEAAAKREEIKLREEEAKVLLREYAAAPDESLTPSALELKRELLRLAPEAPGNAAAMREAQEIADKEPDLCEWQHQFILELKYQEAMSCLADALLVAREREYNGVAILVEAAKSDLDLIGKLTGINGQKRIEGGCHG